MTKSEATAVVVMGVSGSGKTTVGRALAERLGWVFYDGDDYHPAANVAKMASGEPLDDGDRRPWLDRLNRLIAARLAAGQSLVLACSALKRSYRERIRAGNPGVRFVYLKGSEALIARRMSERAGHFMPPELLRSQFEALEEPVHAIMVDIGAAVPVIVQEIVEALPAGGGPT